VGPDAEGPAAPPLTLGALRRANHALDVTIAEPANALTFPVGAGDWLLVSAPRSSGRRRARRHVRWLAGRPHLRVEVIFLESPHRMDITCSLPTRTAEEAWRHPPLDGGGLQTLHGPP
jgi:hypothetical protein